MLLVLAVVAVFVLVALLYPGAAPFIYPLI
jgi:hypothetical protein